MKHLIVSTILVFLIISCGVITPSQTLNNKISVDTYHGKTASVNSYIFSNGQSLVVMDVQRSTEEAKKLSKMIKLKKLPLSHILISHGHPDHYIGMDLLLKDYPTAKIVVANADIKKDIIGFSTWMESVGWLDAEPALKPKTEKNIDGFDYEKNITVLEGEVLKLEGGGELILETGYQAAEAEHVSTVFVKDINGFFMSDLGYNKVHLWMGQGVTDTHIDNWKQQLTQLEMKYKDVNPVIYPGHGNQTDSGMFSEMVEYINNFQRITSTTPSKEKAMSDMKRLYPDYKEADFLLKYSVDFHVN